MCLFFCFEMGFPFPLQVFIAFADLSSHRVLRDMRFTNRLKRTHVFVRYDAVLDREIVTTQLGGPCIHRRECQIMAFESVEHWVVVIFARW